MKLFNWIKSVCKNVAAFFTKAQVEAGEAITGAYGKLDELGRKVVPVAVNVVEALKNFVLSPSSDVVVSIITLAIPGTKDDLLIGKVKDWLEKELPRLAMRLEVVNANVNFMTPESKVKAIIKALQLSDNKGANALEFAAQLSLYLSDGKLTTEELKAAADDYYKKFVKNGN